MKYYCVSSLARFGTCEREGGTRVCMWSARVERPESLRVLINDSQVSGNPFPSNHLCNILRVVASACP